MPAKAVMAAFQKDPQVLITHPRDDVRSLEDMKGKPIMIADATINAFWFGFVPNTGFPTAKSANIPSTSHRFWSTKMPFSRDM